MALDLRSPASVQVFVILFGVGTSETEGIYSLRALSGDDGLPQDTIIAFECEDDAVRCVRKYSHPRLLFHGCRVQLLWVVCT